MVRLNPSEWSVRNTDEPWLIWDEWASLLGLEYEYAVNEKIKIREAHGSFRCQGEADPPRACDTCNRLSGNPHRVFQLNGVIYEAIL